MDAQACSIFISTVRSIVEENVVIPLLSPVVRCYLLEDIEYRTRIGVAFLPECLRVVVNIVHHMETPVSRQIWRRRSTSERARKPGFLLRSKVVARQLT